MCEGDNVRLLATFGDFDVEGYGTSGVNVSKDAFDISPSPERDVVRSEQMCADDHRLSEYKDHSWLKRPNLRPQQIEAIVRISAADTIGWQGARRFAWFKE